MKKAKRENPWPLKGSHDALLKELRPRIRQKINKNGLDDEMVDQPELKGQVSDMLEDAKATVKEIKAEIDLVEAELYVQFKVEDEDNNTKSSDTYIKAKVYATPKMEAIVRRLSFAERKAGELTALKEEVIERGYSIRGLADLYHDQYWQQEESGGKRRAEAIHREATRTMERAGRRMNKGHDDD